MCKEYVNIQTGEKLDLEKVKQLPSNAMLKVKPELWKEWDSEKNDELGLNVWKMTHGSNKKTGWTCDLQHAWEARVYDRTRGKGCPYCSGRMVTFESSLSIKRPELAAQWHPTRNGELTPNDVMSNSSRKVWWKCSNGHEWCGSIKNRGYMGNCQYCSSQKLLKGFNDMWTTNPDLAKLLADPEDGYRYMQASNKKVNWKCPNCGSMIINKEISNIKTQGLSCSNCSDGISYPEKFIRNLLEEMNINFESQTVFNWSDKKRYDFYIPSHNTIIEVHGMQHYYQGFKKLKARTLNEEQANDQYKYESAIANGIEKYIIIDARKSEMNWIKNSILNSKLDDMFNLNEINWQVIHSKALKSIVFEVCELWECGDGVGAISKKLNLSNATVRKYLMSGVELSLCCYDPMENAEKTFIQPVREVVMINLDSQYVKKFKSINDASKFTGLSVGGISALCRGKRKSYGNHKWMYREEYDKYIK